MLVTTPPHKFMFSFCILLDFQLTLPYLSYQYFKPFWIPRQLPQLRSGVTGQVAGGGGDASSAGPSS